ncbi:MAG: DUF6261 family protein [Tannerella sp.]|jgi:hypothetical protein|nr:DUF6261 family protein [Tannerella sp.]
MKIKRIKLTDFRNEEWFNFFTEFKRFVEETSPKTLNIVELFAVFVALYAQADEALEKIIKSSYTTSLVAADKHRDDIFRGLTAAVKSAGYHFDPVQRAAAGQLTLLLDHYGDLAAKPYSEETAAIYNILQEFRGTYAPAVKTLNLDGWVDELERANHDFEAAIYERTHEAAGKTELQVLDVRRQTNRCYLDIVERIEALTLVEGDAAYAPFIKVWNVTVDRYKNALSHHHGKETEKNEDKSNNE